MGQPLGWIHADLPRGARGPQCWGSGAEESEGDDRDAVGTSVGVGSSGEDDEVFDSGAVVFAEPVEVADIFVIDARR